MVDISHSNCVKACQFSFKAYLTKGNTLDSSGQVVLKLHGITKSFPGVLALNDVSIEARAGEVHALVGENGAGKSTLMAIASGALAPDAGTIEIGGQALLHSSPDKARELGLAIVRQDPALLPDLTVAENIAIGVGIEKVGGLRKAVKWAQGQVDPWEMSIDARSRISDLSQEQRFIVEISKALALKPKVLILDEPTEHLNLEEVRRLFAKVREEVTGGACVIYISHRIPEVKEISNVITVLRDGQVRGTFPAADVDENQIIERVIGRSLDTVFPDKGSVSGALGQTHQLAVSSLEGDGFSNINFSVMSGEIVGIAGVQDNGQTELIRALAGLEKASGQITVEGRPMPLGSNHAAARSGVVYVPADRHGEGVLLPLSVGENISSKTLNEVSTVGVVQKSKIFSVARTQIERLSIKTPSSRTPLSSLSGGNQQKVVLARTLLTKPKVLLAEEPTQGVDAGARVDIYNILRGAADNGAAVIVLSSDGVELVGLCDRVLIMSRGTVVDELSGDAITETAITRAALTATSVRSRTDEVRAKQSKLRKWLKGDHSPAAVLSAIFLILGIVVTSFDSSFISSFNINSILFMSAPLIFVGLAQQMVVMGSGFDLSVGPLTGLLVVIASFWCVDKGNAMVGITLMLVAAATIGILNGIFITRLNINPVVMTLATFMAIQGAYLLLRKTPGGIITDHITAVIASSIGPVPAVTILAVILTLSLEWALRRTRWGVELRAVGSKRDAAERLGINARKIQMLSYLYSSLLCFPAAIVLISAIGIGDGRPGLGYTLSSVTVVVLAGASIFGGRGSFIGIAVAALLVEQVLTAAPFLGLSEAWTYLLKGGITIIAAVIFAQIRGARKRA